MSKRVVIAGGGTGGHLFPGVALVESLSELDSSLEFAFVGAKRGIEARVIPNLGYDLRLLDVKPLKNAGLSGAVKGALSLPMSGIQALSFLNELKPDVVIAVGGYAAGPFTAMASVKGVKTALMEQNAVPGLTNQWLGKLVDRAFLSFDSTRSYFPKAECSVLGNPIRKTILERSEGFKYRKPDAGDFRILVIGGSGGARSINVGLPKALMQLPDELRQRVVVKHQVGKGRLDSARAAYETVDFRHELVEFVDDMAQAYSNADLLICRAGMSTIAEVTALGIPALYVPLETADGHQLANATEIVEAGGGMMVRDAEIADARVARLLTGVMQNPESLVNLAMGAKKCGRPDAGLEVAREVLDWIS